MSGTTKLNYSIDPNEWKKEAPTAVDTTVDTDTAVDYQLFNDFQNGLANDINKKQQDIEVASSGVAPDGGSTVS